MMTLLKKLVAPLFALGMIVAQALPAFACGGLVAPNGAIRLSRATTLVSWHDGIERYMTSFSYQGAVSSLGWIVPLPAVPLSIEKGGAWTLQRLFRETHPQPVTELAGFGRPALSSARVEVLQQTKIDALDITVIRGSGEAVLEWTAQNGFVLDADTHAHLLAYAKGSPIFMAAKYDTAAARARHLLAGDGSPILITMKTAHIWVPLEVLALDGQIVHADLYLLTDGPVTTSDLGASFGQSAVGKDVPDAPGMKLAFQKQLTPTLYHDLSIDRNMGWVRSESWLTYLSLDAPEPAVTYDLGVSSSGVIRLAPFGTAPMDVVDSQKSRELPGWLPRLAAGPLQAALPLVFLFGIGGALLLVAKSRTRS